MLIDLTHNCSITSLDDFREVTPLETREYLARFHRRVVTELIEAVLDEWAGDMGDLARNVPGAALRQEVETRLVPGLLAVDALLLGAGGDTLARLTEWLDRVQTPLPAEAEFFTEMCRLLDPVVSSLVEENLALRPGGSVPSRVFTDYLWVMAPLASGPSLES